MATKPLPGLGPRTPLRRSEPLDDDQSERRSIRSRRVIPSGRAVIGGLLVTASALGVFAAYAGASTGPKGQAVAVTGSVPSGHVLTAGDLTVVPVELPEGTAAGSFASVHEVVGSVTLAPLAPDELVQRSAVLPHDADRPPVQEFSFPVARERAVDGDLRAGESVDILATFGSGPDAYTSVLARPATVVSIHDAGRSTLAGNSVVLTVALDSADQVLDVAHAAQVAELTVVRSTGVDTTTEAGDSTAAPGRVTAPSGPEPQGSPR